MSEAKSSEQQPTCLQIKAISQALRGLDEFGISRKMLDNLEKPGGPEKIKRILEILNEPVNRYASLITEWEEFYLKYFDIKTNLKDVIIPEITGQGQPKRLVIIIPIISVNKVIKSLKKQFKVVMEVSGPPAKLKDERNSHKPYAIWVAKSQEPHRKLRSKSADWAKEQNFSGETLLERLLHGFKYWDETGRHLDETFMTVCTGSRYFNGFVPIVSSAENEISIGQNGTNVSLPVLGLREIYSNNI